MASVNLPNTEGMTTLDELKNAIGKLTKELTWLLQNLDTRNVNELNAEVIVANTITAEKMLITELSAITANLGHIITGILESVEIYGSKISTNRYGYPKVEISNTQDMVGAYINPYNGVEIFASNNDKLSPVIRFGGAYNPSYIFYDSSDNSITMTSNSAKVNLSTNSAIELFAPEVRVTSWSSIVKNGTTETLEDALISVGYDPMAW